MQSAMGSQRKGRYKEIKAGTRAAGWMPIIPENEILVIACAAPMGNPPFDFNSRRL